MSQIKLKINNYVFVSLLSLILLSGCVGVVSNSCPPIVTYSSEQQLGAAEELLQLDPNSEVLNMMTDYAQLRQQLEYCY